MVNLLCYRDLDTTGPYCRRIYMPDVELKEKFEGDLSDSSSLGASHESKQSPILDVAIRIVELGVVEHIEELEPELEKFRFRQMEVLQQRRVEVVESRPIEEAPPGAAQLPEGLKAEQRCVEIW